MGKRLSRGEFLGVLLLVFATAFAGFMGVNKRLNDANTKNVATENKEYSGKSYYYIDDEYEDDYYYDYNDYENLSDYLYTGNYSYDYYNNYNYDYNNYYYYNDDDSYQYEGYKNYNGTSYNYNSSIYNDKTAPSIRYTRSDIVYQYSSYDPWKGVSATHSKFGDVTDYIEITYNDVNVNVPGNYSVVYKACNYPGSIYCRTVTKTVTVKALSSVKNYTNVNRSSNNNTKYTNNTNYNYNYTNDYSKAPVWSNNDTKTCTQGNSSCNTYNITKPTAKDPYSNRTLNVSLISGNVDIYTPGTYVLVYRATTEHNISGTIAKKVTINASSSYNNNNNYNYNYNYNNNYNSNTQQTRKYISNYSSSYYDDGQYRGTLSANSNTQQTRKYISNYKWTNKVSYTYRCDSQGAYGKEGWRYISTNTSDNHPTYSYNVGGYTGTLNRVDAYCLKGSGCEEDLARSLGTCTNLGEYKTVYRTWVGLYSGYVYSNQNKTYSGYVYSYR